MAIIQSVRGFTPTWQEGCFFAENAVLIGDVVLGKHCSVWFNTVLRGDVNYIRIGDNTNIQDGTVIHGTYQKYGTTIGNGVSIGHSAVIHGCTIQDNCLIGMGAIILDGAVIQEGSLIAAGAVVLEHTITEAKHLYAGIPAKKIKPLSDEMLEAIRRNANQYLMYKEWYS
ncbi:MAG: gamma carbonic anhydrase family protein [Cytophagales bacterium]|nr:gamma carbonic anhydrase family protein [Cytophagales bacterium]MDW8384914.1 gamma carbonic anhydrase family protein [Flammeovirgaceae bacterium]